MKPQVLLLLATASLETGQPRTTLNCIDRLRGEAKAAGTAEDDMEVDGGDAAAAPDRTTGACVRREYTNSSSLMYRTMRCC